MNVTSKVIKYSGQSTKYVVDLVIDQVSNGPNRLKFKFESENPTFPKEKSPEHITFNISLHEIIGFPT